MNAPLQFQSRTADTARRSFESGKTGPSQHKCARDRTLVPPVAHAAPLPSDQPIDAANHSFTRPGVGHNFSRVKIHYQSKPLVQTKLSIGTPGDRFEREADQIAEQVMQMGDPISCNASKKTESPVLEQIEPANQRQQHIQREMRQPYSLEEGSEEEEKQTVQTRASPGHTPTLTPASESRIEGLRGGGQPLPEPVRALMESRFAHDFGKVRIHNNCAAAELATSINARAFTLGPDLVFGPNQYAPETQTGFRLLAHELTHSIQQGHARYHTASAIQPKMRDDSAMTEPTPLTRPVDRPTVAGSEVVRRVQWVPNVDTGKKKRPWGTGPDGKILKGKTDKGTEIPIWKPDDGKTYWCHGFTFGGVTAPGGPYSLWGKDVPTVLKDDGWKSSGSCTVSRGDILVFEGNDPISHSGIVKSVAAPGRSVDEDASMLDSKWGSGSQNISSWQTNAQQWGRYGCYSKSPGLGACKYRGPSEADESLPLPPGDFPLSKGENKVV